MNKIINLKNDVLGGEGNVPKRHDQQVKNRLNKSFSLKQKIFKFDVIILAN